MARLQKVTGAYVAEESSMLPFMDLSRPLFLLIERTSAYYKTCTSRLNPNLQLRKQHRLLNLDLPVILENNPGNKLIRSALNLIPLCQLLNLSSYSILNDIHPLQSTSLLSLFLPTPQVSSFDFMPSYTII